MTPCPTPRSATVVRSLFAEALPRSPDRPAKLLLAGEEFDTWAAGDVVVKFPKRADHAASSSASARSSRCSSTARRADPRDPRPGRSDGRLPVPDRGVRAAAGRQGQTSDGPDRPAEALGARGARAGAGAACSRGCTPPRSDARRPPAWSRATWRSDAGVEAGEDAIAWASRIAGDAVDRFLVDPIPVEAQRPGKAVLCHGDLKGEHLFVSEDGTPPHRDRSTGRTLTIADPACGPRGARDLAGADLRARGPRRLRRGPPTRAPTTARSSWPERGCCGYLDEQLAGLDRTRPCPLLDAQLRAVFAA